jgi:hypothetical protein
MKLKVGNFLHSPFLFASLNALKKYIKTEEHLTDVMQRGRKLILPARPLRRTTFTLPVDRLEFLDECAHAIGQDRSGFLSIVLDGFEDEIAAFAKGYVARIMKQVQNSQEKASENAERVEPIPAPQG